MDLKSGDREFVRRVDRAVHLVLLCLVLMAGACLLFFRVNNHSSATPEFQQAALAIVNRPGKTWQPPDSTLIPMTPEGDVIRYGRELIAHTAKYLGPKGTVMRISNGMNCQNCHLKAGQKPFGNNYSAVVSNYPRFRARSGTLESIERRINDCLMRSLNGAPLADDSREMRAMIAWFQWLGKDVQKGVTPVGAGITNLAFMKRPADPVLGKSVYAKQCQRCHGIDAGGMKHRDSVEWQYPPLAGMQSYNTGAGLYRLSRFAGYVKSNMPHGTTYDKPLLTDEEAWDVAAYINSLPRPHVLFPQDWPDISKKPFDHPFGPFADSFSESQHKYGPYHAIRAAQANQ